MIEGSECGCGRKVVPARVLCPACGKNMEKTAFTEEGRVLTHTTLYAVPEGYIAPISLALVELDCTARLICGYKGKAPLNIDDRVRIQTEEDLYYCALLKRER